MEGQALRPGALRVLPPAGQALEPDRAVAAARRVSPAAPPRALPQAGPAGASPRAAVARARR